MRYFFLLSIVAIAGCKTTAPTSSTKEYSDAEISLTKEINIEIPALQAAGVPYKTFQNIYKLGGDGSLDIKLGKVTPEQCQALKKSLYDNKFTCAERAGMDYEIADFLPPMVQALNGKTFHDEYLIKGQSQTYRNGIVQTNCWNTAYEFVRAHDTTSYDLFYAEPSRMKQTMTNPGLSKRVGLVTSTADVDAMRDQLKFGDYIMIYEPERQQLVHAAVYLDGQLFFQKFSIAKHPIGLVPSQTLFDTYGKLAKLNRNEAPFTYEIRRLTADPKLLPVLSHAPDIEARVATFRRNETTKRWELDEELVPPETATVAEPCPTTAAAPVEFPPVVTCKNNHYGMIITQVDRTKYAYRVEKYFGDRKDLKLFKTDLYLKHQDEWLYFMDKPTGGSTEVEFYLQPPNMRCYQGYLSSLLKGGGRDGGRMKCEW